MFQSLLSYPRIQTDRAGQTDPLPAAPERPGILKRWVIHPFLLALFPILGLFAQNSAQVPYRDLLMPITLALGEPS